MNRFVDLSDRLVHYVNVLLELYSKKALRARARHVGERVSFNIRWNHLIVPPLIDGDGNLCIGNDVVFWGKVSFFTSSRLSNECKIEIGDATEIGDDVVFRAFRSIKVGRKCQIASGVRVFDSNGHAISPVLRDLGWKKGGATPPEEIKPICIEDNVWIGERAFIHPGVTVGRNSIVAAGANVTKDVPPNVIVAGTPARVSFWLDRKAQDHNQLDAAIPQMPMFARNS